MSAQPEKAAINFKFALPVIIFFAVALAFAFGLTRDPHTLPSALIDQQAPDFDLPPIDGSDIPGFSKADLLKEVSLVNVFASWCLPCRAEHPQLMKLADEMSIPLYAINKKDQAEDALSFLDRLGNPYRRIGADTDGRTSIDWGVYGVPETYVVDARGHIRYRHVGPILPPDIGMILDKIKAAKK